MPRPQNERDYAVIECSLPVQAGEPDLEPSYTQAGPEAHMYRLTIYDFRASYHRPGTREDSFATFCTHLTRPPPTPRANDWRGGSRFLNFFNKVKRHSE